MRMYSLVYVYSIVYLSPQSLVRGANVVLQKSQSGGFLDLWDRRKAGGCSTMVSRGMILVGVGVVGRDGEDGVVGWAGVAKGVVVGVGWVEKRASASFGGGGVQRGHGQGVCASNGVGTSWSGVACVLALG